VEILVASEAEEWQFMKIMNIAMNDQKEAIINDGIAINLDSSE
jgi:hypothetical protein